MLVSVYTATVINTLACLSVTLWRIILILIQILIKWNSLVKVSTDKKEQKYAEGHSQRTGLSKSHLSERRRLRWQDLGLCAPVLTVSSETNCE